MNRVLIGLSLAAIFAWLFGRKISAGVPVSSPPVEGYDYWRAKDDEAIRQFTAANQDRMLAPLNSRAASEAQARYDRWFALHREYAAKANAAYNIERGVVKP